MGMDEEQGLKEKRKTLKKQLFETKYPKYQTYDAMSSADIAELDQMVESGLGLFQKQIERERTIANTELVRGFFYGTMFWGMISIILKWF